MLDKWNKIFNGYEIFFTYYFFNYVSPCNIEEITSEIFELKKETEEILNEIVNE